MADFIIEKNFNYRSGFSFSNLITRKFDKDNLSGNIFPLKIRKSQSLSTNYEDKKDTDDNEDNENSSTKKINLENNNNKTKIVNKIKNLINVLEKSNNNISKNKYFHKFLEYTNEKSKIFKISKQLKAYPPIMPNLFNNLFILYSRSISSNLFGKNCYKSIKSNKIPNNFYNHLMININKNNNSYFNCSITKRINKNKKILIIYYRPVKNNI